MSHQPVIIVPWDFSDFSATALNFALERHPDADVHVVCVLEKPNPYASEWVWSEETEAEAIQKSVEAFKQSPQAPEGHSYRFTSLFGDPASEIVRLANDLQADSIIMSTHGRTGLKKWMLGSVAQRVTEQARCPVCLLPATWVEANSNDKPTMQSAT